MRRSGKSDYPERIPAIPSDWANLKSTKKPYIAFSELEGGNDANIADPGKIRQELDDRIGAILRYSQSYPRDLRHQEYLTRRHSK